MGVQMAGGIPALKQWIVNLDEDMIQVPFPDGFRGPDTSFDVLSPGRWRRWAHAGSSCRRDDRDVPGRQCQLRSARVHAATPPLVRRAPRAADHGRSPGRFRPHGHVLGLRALRHRARPDLLRQRDLQRDADLGRDRPARNHGPVPAGLDDLDPHGQSGLRRGGHGQRAA